MLSRRFDARRRVERRFPLFSCVCVFFARGSLTGQCKFWRWRPVGAAPAERTKITLCCVFAGFRRRWSERALAEMPFILISRENCCFMFHRAIVADRVVERLRDRLVAARCSLLFLSSLMAFVCTFRVCHARDLAWELVMATTAAAHCRSLRKCGSK